MVQVEQNLAICIILSAVGGMLEVVATAVLAVQDAKQKQGKESTAMASKLCLLANIVLQIAASIVGNLLAPWYGPVSIVGPTFLSAQLVMNMVLYGSVLGLESFTKDMRIGTCVIVTAAILLPVVGPGVQVYEQNVEDLLTTWYSYIWNATLVLGMILSGLVLLIRSVSTKFCQLESIPTRYAVLLVARATSFAVNLSFSKVFALDPTFPWLVISITLKVFSGMVMTGSIVVQSTAVSQNTFVPLNATILILVNALTGIIIWQDGSVVASWLGYGTVFVQLIVGNYLLLGEIDLFGPQNQRYGRRLVLTRILSSSVVPPPQYQHDSSCSDTTPWKDDDHHHGRGYNNNKGRPSAMHRLYDLESGGAENDPIPTPTWTLDTALDDASDPTPASVRSHVSGDIAAAWLSSGGESPLGSIESEENGQAVMDFHNSVVPQSGSGGDNLSLPAVSSRPSPLSRPTTINHNNNINNDDNKTTPTLTTSSSLSRPTRITTRSTSGGGISSATTTNQAMSNDNNNNFSRPTSLSQRSQTTGGAHNPTKTTSQHRSSLSCPTDPLASRPSTMQASERCHTTGVMVDSAQLQAVSRRRSHYFGSTRRQAWGDIFGVDPSWLERRSSVRRMEPIVELTTTTSDMNININDNDIAATWQEEEEDSNGDDNMLTGGGDERDPSASSDSY